ncbi:unnamed protein product [Brachyspira suanatina]|uniref:Uncharacterized protein n=1 Tax=Brachyspira suanatina TaxID=381802 RepID=A0A0G4KAQ1_9SPIR|nr:hypothetical protein [Brachyspira suanatina]CRF35480.1 unnamed protein product [Brachyspira suanatina]
MAVKLFSKEELQKCTTEKEVDAYFDSLGIDEENYEQKINALTEALESQQIKCFSETSLKNRYKDILSIFLDEEVRMYRGF